MKKRYLTFRIPVNGSVDDVTYEYSDHPPGVESALKEAQRRRASNKKGTESIQVRFLNALFDLMVGKKINIKFRSIFKMFRRGANDPLIKKAADGLGLTGKLRVETAEHPKKIHLYITIRSTTKTHSYDYGTLYNQITKWEAKK